MKDLNDGAFRSVFLEACKKCFGMALTAPLSETDSKQLSNKILGDTGLVIGAKSLKNYSLYVVGSGEAKKENPSVSTLDTLARYVMGAPYTDEATRRGKEDHNPYWFDYRSRYSTAHPNSAGTSPALPKPRRKLAFMLAAMAVAAAVIVGVTYWGRRPTQMFRDTFSSVTADTLVRHGWMIKNADPTWWAKRDTLPGYLTLYTLKGDNWADAQNPARIKNLVMHPLDAECFSMELHLSDFFPQHNWQQAGLLLSEDSTYQSKAIRLSVSYNNFFGGYDKSPEIIIQALSSSETGNISKPEEFTHFTLFSIDAHQDTLVRKNLSKIALKIEKKGNHFRFLYSAGSRESFAFKEVASGTFNIRPAYVSLFAIQGHAPIEQPMAVRINSFAVVEMDCNP